LRQLRARLASGGKGLAVSTAATRRQIRDSAGAISLSPLSSDAAGIAMASTPNSSMIILTANGMLNRQQSFLISIGALKSLRFGQSDISDNN
jgi:hypothetical protein